VSMPALLRVYRDYIRQAGFVRFEQPHCTVYVAPAAKPLLRQHKAMELLRHLDVAPRPGRIQPLRGLWVMTACHRRLSELMPVWQRQSRQGKIELIRRLGATLGMVHSQRHSGTGDIVAPGTRPIGHYLLGLARKYHALARGERAPFQVREIAAAITGLWDNGGGTLTGNWRGFPPVRIWDSGLMIMDLSRASYSEPLLDLVNLRPQVIGLDDIAFFWEYFLQGYCATGELPANWRQKLEVLYKLKVLQALAEGRYRKEAMDDWQSRWWEQYDNYI